MEARRRSPALALGLAAVMAAALAVPVSADGPQAPSPTLDETLARAGERVEYYFARAQSLVCEEVVLLQPLGFGLSPSGRSRTVASELRLSWDPEAESDTPLEATTIRKVVAVNGHPPRKNDYNNCTTPEQRTSETQPLSMLLPQRRSEYEFRAAGTSRQDGRDALVVDFQMKAKPTVEVTLVNDDERCIGFQISGGTRGRLWIDAETHDVLRLDQGLAGQVDFRLPWRAARHAPERALWTVERMDTSIRFRAVTFSDPDETLILPVSSSSLRVTRGAGTPRLRTITEYANYRRFLTGARIVPPGPDD
jgi:hypothetical protein